jgi:hypothetical protein
VARDDAGDTVVAWQEYIAFANKGGITETLHDWSVDARKVSAAGTLGSELHIAVGSGIDLGGQGGSSDYTLPSVVMNLSSGAFAVGYHERSSNDVDGQTDLDHVTEVSAHGKIEATYDIHSAQKDPELGTNDSIGLYSGLSINAQGVYLLSYTDLSTTPVTVNFQVGKLA